MKGDMIGNINDVKIFNKLLKIWNIYNFILKKNKFLRYWYNVKVNKFRIGSR